YRESIARVASLLDHWPGRTWRSLQDTADSAPILYDASEEWSSWRREVDFYNESILIWLEADVIIRQKSGGRLSLDDFCRKFHGGQSGPPEVKPYTFDDVVAAMNEIQPYDWKSFFEQHLNSKSPHAPLNGILESGWHLTYTEQQNGSTRARNFA